MPIRYLGDTVFPARDQSPGAVFRTLSEPESGPHADNLMSNEDSYPRAVGTIARLAPPDSVYLGVGPDQNLTYLAHANPCLAFVADFRRRNAIVHLLHKALLMLSKDRVTYLTRFLARSPRPLPAEPTAEHLIEGFGNAPLDRDRLAREIEEVAEVLRPYGIVQPEEFRDLATIQRRLAGPGLNARFLALPMYPTLGQFVRSRDSQGTPAHFLSEERLYQVVRNAQLGDRVIPIVADVAGKPAIASLGRWLTDRGLRVGVFYISDVEFFLIRGGAFPAYLENLRALPWAKGALVVRTSTRPITHPDRVAGDSATTVVREVEPFLASARLRPVRSHDDLFQDAASTPP